MIPVILQNQLLWEKTKKLEDLKKDLKTLQKKDMKKIVGGKNDKKKNKFNNGLGGIVPQ